MSNHPIAHRENTIIAGVGDAAYVHQTQQTTSIGNIRRTGVTVNIRSTYAARYNFAVENYNSLRISDKKKKMRGGHFLLYRFVVVILWLISIICGGISAVAKPLVVIPIIIALFYFALTIYNIVIFKKNVGVLHGTLMIHNNDLSSNNEWYTVPIHTRIQDNAALAAVGGDNSAAMAAIRQEYTDVEEIKIMVYTERYIRFYTSFPLRSIVIHIVLFLISFIFGIGLAAGIR